MPYWNESFGEVMLTSSPLILICVGEIDAAEHVHQRRLAGAVFPQQCQDFAAAQLQIDLVIGDRRTKSLCDILHLDRVRCITQWVHPFFEKMRRSGAANPARLLAQQTKALSF